MAIGKAALPVIIIYLKVGRDPGNSDTNSKALKGSIFDTQLIIEQCPLERVLDIDIKSFG